jgi:hypothetical protein
MKFHIFLTIIKVFQFVWDLDSILISSKEKSFCHTEDFKTMAQTILSGSRL